MAAAVDVNPPLEDEKQISTQPPSLSLSTGLAVRLACRSNTLTTVTSGLAPTHLQANLIILPSRYAADFRLLCARNPVPCPLIAESSTAGSYTCIKSCNNGLSDAQILSDVDIRRDAPRYMVYRDSQLAKKDCLDICSEWTDDHVAFLIGCSYSFESALKEAGLEDRHTKLGRNVPMYRTNVPLCPAGVFTGGTYVVSMRPYKASEIERVREITRGYSETHGEPIAWGWDAVARLGIGDIDAPDWGEVSLTLTKDGRFLGDMVGSEEEVPVFWGCGVTPQEAVMRAGIEGTVMAHSPGHMLLLDVRDHDIIQS
ncbi:DUF1445 domain-containing protein [Pseudomassariella vexata]|uniref:DUF1445 domain-containing protein n=1 Tax=Pseudomassariella vexata TaxID=1141098 RepID=A0A1Y2DXK2_9PEZI|nr:DUF1445 domain-containing protein [Pseudomassariella vexata]ORY64022.1 DUF1445 domain-containing protein [Pseudomassariella vexata]